MVETPEGRVVATTFDWFCIREDGRWYAVPNGPPRISVPQLTVARDGAVLACTSAPDATFVELRGDRLVPIWTSSLDTRGTVQYIGEAPDGAIWLAGTNLLARWERLGGEWTSFDDLPQPQLRDVEEGIWFAEEDRVLRLKEDQWTRFPQASRPLIGDSSGGVWMRTTSGLARWSSGGFTRFAEGTMGVTDPGDASVDGVGNLWVIGRGLDGRRRLARFDGEKWASFPMTDVKPTERIVFGTPDPRSGMWYVLEDSATDFYRLLRVDGASLVDVPLPDEARRFWMPRVRADGAGRLWLFGFLGLYRRDLDAQVPAWEQITELPGKQVLNVVERGKEVWFSYQGGTGGSGGVTRLLDGAWDHFSSAARNLTARNGDDALFFTHPRGVYVAARGSTLAPRLLALPEPTWVESIVSGLEGDLWIGSSTEVLHYTPDGIPPETVIVYGEKDIRYGEDLVLQVRGVERFKPLDRLGDFNVSVQLDDQPWGEFEPLSRGTVTVSNLTTGDHIVRVRVQDQGLDVDETPAAWHFRLHPVPLQDRSWFQPLVVAILLTVLTLGGLSVAAYRRELEQRRRKQELEHEILEVSEREQRRIGQDLHDGLGQRLTSISFQCEALRGMLKTSDAFSSQRLREIGTAVRAAIAETRTLAHALYPAEVDSGDLQLALGHLVGSVDRGFDGKCTYHHHWSPVVLSREDALNVYRLVQEALGNAIRHSGATTLHVESRRDDGQWILEVRDDGCGFDIENTAGRGLGLQIMRYRADLVGGSLIVVSHPGAGTTIRCVLRIGGKES
jgi:signal transduction histidine kinase